MANLIVLTVTKKNGDTVTSYSQQFAPEVMRDVKINSAGTALSFAYPSQSGWDSYESTSYTSLSVFNSAVTLASPSGTQTYVGVYDPSANTSQRAIGSHNFLDSNGNALILPDNTRVWDGYYEVVTTFTSATDAGTISLDIATDDVAGIFAATAISSGTTWDAAAPKAIIQVGTIAAISEKTNSAAGRAVQATVAVEALTAGKVYLVLFCVTTPT
jgi:hypothetical protein